MKKIKCNKCEKDIEGKRGGFSWKPNKFISYFCECGVKIIKCDKCEKDIEGFEIPGYIWVFNDDNCKIRTKIEQCPCPSEYDRWAED